MGENLILLYVLECLLDDGFREVVIVVDFLAHFEEGFDGHLIFVFGIVQVGVQYYDGIGKSVDDITVLENRS